MYIIEKENIIKFEFLFFDKEDGPLFNVRITHNEIYSFYVFVNSFSYNNKNKNILYKTNNKTKIVFKDLKYIFFKLHKFLTSKDSETVKLGITMLNQYLNEK